MAWKILYFVIFAININIMLHVSVSVLIVRSQSSLHSASFTVNVSVFVLLKNGFNTVLWCCLQRLERSKIKGAAHNSGDVEPTCRRAFRNTIKTAARKGCSFSVQNR